ncbi:hypothetical protein E1301_Tti002076 [Triplophysa tibetana]|uniref:Uncharacterized protein n=1 Tax=Triplophysa tibetana TaxID=1572043 RepID=A0A5A9PGR1_9TELE|nr:hypothetical protein E1301_Tti002076 [Triplophysa tibetana]
MAFFHLEKFCEEQGSIKSPLATVKKDPLSAVSLTVHASIAWRQNGPNLHSLSFGMTPELFDGVIKGRTGFDVRKRQSYPRKTRKLESTRKSACI